jgi:hypothetical protein
LTATFSGGQLSFNGASNFSGTAMTGQSNVQRGSCVDGSSVGLALGR